MAGKNLQSAQTDAELDFLVPSSGAGDARTFLQDMIDSKRAGQDGLHCRLRPGTYSLRGAGATGLELRSGVHLQGGGWGTVLFADAGTAFDHLLRVGADGRGHAVRISDLVIDANGTLGKSRCIEVAQCSNLILERVWLRNCRNTADGHAVFFSGGSCFNVWIEGCLGTGLPKKFVLAEASAALTGALIQHNRVITLDSAYLSIAGSGVYHEPDNIVTENGVTRITGGGAAAPGSWTTLTKDAGWGNITGRPVLAYYFDAFGRVYLRGEVDATATKNPGDRIAAALPTPDTPSSAPLEFRCEVEKCHVNTAGELVFQGPAGFTGNLSFNGVHYRKT